MGAHSKKKYRSRNSNYMNFRVRNDVHAAVAADFREWKNTEKKKIFFFLLPIFSPEKKTFDFRWVCTTSLWAAKFLVR